MKKILTILFILTAFFADDLFCGEITVYKNPGFKFQITYPSDWEKKETGGYLFFLSEKESDKDIFREYVNVFLENLHESAVTLEQYQEITLKNAPIIVKSFNLLQKGNDKIAGEKAYYLIYEMHSEKIDLKFKAYTFIKNKIAYTITFAAQKNVFDKYLPLAEKTMRSFSFFQ